MKPRTWRRLLHLARPVMARAISHGMRDRSVDPHDPARGRLDKADRRQILDATYRHLDRLWDLARLEELPTVGSQLNVCLAMLTVGMYRSLLDRGLPRDQAIRLVADAGWWLYQAGARPVVMAARLRHRNQQDRLRFALRAFLRFPFGATGRPGYEVEVTETPAGMDTTWTWCPPQTFVRRVVAAEDDRGELECFQRSWCHYDWAFNDRLVDGRGDYRRPHTLSAGEDRCDMHWAVQPTDTPHQSRRVREKEVRT